MAGPQSATAAACRLALQCLGRGLLLILEILEQVLSPAPWEILVGTLLEVYLMVKRPWTSRSLKEPGKSCSSQDKVGTSCSESIGPMTEVDDTFKSPEVEATPLLLKTLCLKALNKQLSRLSFQDTVILWKRAHKSQTLKLSQVTDAKPISKTLGIDVEQCQKNVMNALNKNSHYPESSELHLEEMLGWKQKIQEKKKRLEQLKKQMEQVLQDISSQSMSVAGNSILTIPKPDNSGADMDDGNLKFPQNREAKYGDGFVHGSKVVLKGVPHDAGIVSLQCADKENKEIARQLLKQKQRNEEVAAEIASLQTEKASLQHENSNLKDEIKQLKQKLEIATDVYEDPVIQLQKKLFEEETLGLLMEKKVFNVWRNINSNDQFLNMYKKMVQDMNEELRRSTFYYENEIRCYQRRAEEACMAAKFTERKLECLRRASDCNKQMLAKVKSKCVFQPFPHGPFASDVLPTVYRGPDMPGHESPIPQKKVRP